ncbi:type II secretion system protein [Patescibacteria group bacterium]|nr:type II secretion system protein [Patescibacteria group bacterium]
MPFLPLHPTSRSGFTMIELLVTIGIMILIFGGGISAYLRLDRRQSLVNVCKELEQMARSAQKKARVGDRPEGCDRLNAYRISRTATGPDVISLQAVCDSGTSTIQTYEVPTIFTVQTITTMNFRVLHGGLEEDVGEIEVTASAPNYRCDFTVDNGGSISSTTISQY